MNAPIPIDDLQLLESAGLPAGEVAKWQAAAPAVGGEWQADLGACSAYWQLSRGLLEALPPKPGRDERAAQAAHALLDGARRARERFLAAHVATVYERLTDGRSKFLRVEEIAALAAQMFPGLVPDSAVLAREGACLQMHKDGHEIDQGLLLAHILADPACGSHLCHAMLLPHPQTVAYLEQFEQSGRVDLGTASVERVGGASIVSLKNPSCMNAEDETTLDATEVAIDLATLDPSTQIAVLRGAPVDRGRHAGKRVFCSGINLTHLYHGKIGYLWYMRRDLGAVNKVFRGIAFPDRSPDEVLGHTAEKLWICAIDAFAIGGGCQYLLAMDVNIAGSDAYMTLPARKEGIIPGAANLRMPRFVGDRIARQAVMMDRRIECDSAEGRMICDQVVEPGQVDAALMQTIENITRSGVVSAAGNRRAFRVAHEPLDLFRRYMAVYAREQAYCHFSPALIRNLENFWNAHSRRC